MRFAFIDAQQASFSICALCRAMEVARSGYYAWAARLACARKREDRVLAVHIAAAFARSRRTYGSPRMLKELREDGHRVGRRRTARIMRENGMFARRRKAWRRSVAGCGSERAAPNLLDRNFTARAPNQAWVTDVKYVRTKEGWLYLAPVIDLFSRRVVGYAMSTQQDGDLSIAALESAVRARGAPKGLVLHSDRGGIYGDGAYLKQLKSHGIERSMSRPSNPWDNAAMESFFSTLHFELLSRRRFERSADAQDAIAEWIDGFYNPQRRHTTIGNTSPIKHELTWQMRQQRT